MELSAGTRVGPYEILRAIGAGGMGVVYRAIDSRLGRQVAIKVLPTALEGEPDRMRRFEQEARTIGGLNHPNLVTLHDVGHHDGAPFLVTELLDGRSLRTHLAGEPLAVREAIRIAIEIARGLAAAHGAGIVHRDIKPDNVFLTADGRVKILDFGIAKLKREEPAADLANAATAPTAATGTGVVIGTPGYMAPEQLSGGAVDARTDLFALGVVLYETLAGRRPFAGATGIEESYAILKSPPADLPASVPIAVARIVTRCLEKRPDARFQSASDLAFALDAVDGASSTRTTAIATASPTITTVAATPVSTIEAPRRRRLWLLAFTVVVLAALLTLWWTNRRTPVATAAGGWNSLVGGGPRYKRVTFEANAHGNARFSADGDSVFYSVGSAAPRVYRADIDPWSMSPLGITGNLTDVSPKGELAIVDAGNLSTVVPGRGASPIVAEKVSDGVWAPDGRFVVVRDGNTLLEHPPGSVIVRRPAGAIMHPRVSPAGRIAFIDGTRADTRGRVVVVGPAGAPIAQSKLYDGVEGIAWSSDGREVWFSTGRMLRALALDGTERVVMHGMLPLNLCDIAADGRILIAPTDARSFVYVRRRESLAEVGWQTASVATSITPDGKTISLLQSLGEDATVDGYAIYTRRIADDLSRSNDTLPVLIGRGFGSALLPDGTAVVAITRTGLRELPTQPGPAVELPISPIEGLDMADALAVSATGRYIVVRGAERDRRTRLWLIDRESRGPARPIGPDVFEGRHHPVSPDGAWIAIEGKDRGVRLIATADGRRIDLTGEPEDIPIGFAADGKALFVLAHGRRPLRIDRVALPPASGRVPEIGIDVPDTQYVHDIAIAGDGSTVVYSYARFTGDLVVVSPPGTAAR